MTITQSYGRLVGISTVLCQFLPGIQSVPAVVEITFIQTKHAASPERKDENL